MMGRDRRPKPSFVIANYGDKGLFIELNGEIVCDYYPSNHERAVVIEIIKEIADVLDIPVKRVRRKKGE